MKTINATENFEFCRTVCTIANQFFIVAVIGSLKNQHVLLPTEKS